MYFWCNLRKVDTNSIVIVSTFLYTIEVQVNKNLLVELSRRYFMKLEAGANPELSRSRERELKQKCHWETGKTLKR